MALPLLTPIRKANGTGFSAPRLIVPSADEKTLRCGKCGRTEFTVMVKFAATGQPRVSGIVCGGCRNLVRADGAGVLQGSVRHETARGPKHRKAINDRPDT